MMRKQKSYFKFGISLCLGLVLFGIMLVTVKMAQAANMQLVADTIVMPRNYQFTWGSSGQNIDANNEVFCSSNPDFWQVLYWQTTDTNWSSGINDWNPTVPVNGNYDIYVFIPNYTHSAPITTQARYYLDGNLLATLDQNQNKCDKNIPGSGWVLLGRRWLGAGTGQTFSMPARTSDNPYRLIAADGLKLVYINTTPVANAQSLSTAEDTARIVTLTGSDADGDGLTYSLLTSPTHGTLGGSPPNLTYTPHLNYAGPDSFTFRVNDGTVNSNTATITITISAVQDLPVANPQTLSTAEDTVLGITLNGSDADGDALTCSLLSSPTHGSLSGTPPNVSYTPALNYAGPDSFTFKVNDGTVNSNTATVTITVSAVNDTPVANAQTLGTAEDTALGITLTGSDVEGSPLTYSLITSPGHGSLGGSPPNLFYTPALNYAGSDSFTFRVNDGTANSNTATVTITVRAVNDAPVANAQTLSTAEDTVLGITLTGSDEDGDTLTYSLITSPGHGSLGGSPPNLFYTPALNYDGSDSFTFRVNDGTVNSNTATVTITTNAVDDAPVAGDQSLSTAQNTPLNVTLTGSDPDGNSVTYSIVNFPAHGSLGGTLPNMIYSPAMNYYGPDSFTFRVNDGTENSNTATVNITVQPPPVEGNMVINLASQRVFIGNLFTVKIQVQAGAQIVDGAQVSLNFDPAYLRIKQMSGNTTLLPLVLQNEYNNTLGTLDYAAGALSNYPTGTFTLVEIQFEALNITPDTSLTFELGVPRKTDITSGGASILSVSNPSSVEISDKLRLYLPYIIQYDQFDLE